MWGGTLRFPFDPNRLAISDTGRIYHPSPMPEVTGMRAFVSCFPSYPHVHACAGATGTLLPIASSCEGKDWGCPSRLRPPPACFACYVLGTYR